MSYIVMRGEGRVTDSGKKRELSLWTSVALIGTVLFLPYKGFLPFVLCIFKILSVLMLHFIWLYEILIVFL